MKFTVGDRVLWKGTKYIGTLIGFVHNDPDLSSYEGWYKVQFDEPLTDEPPPLYTLICPQDLLSTQ